MSENGKKPAVEEADRLNRILDANGITPHHAHASDDQSAAFLEYKRDGRTFLITVTEITEAQP